MRLAQEEARKVELRRQRELARFARGRTGMLRVGLLDEGLSSGTLLGGGQRVTAGP